MGVESRISKKLDLIQDNGYNVGGLMCLIETISDFKKKQPRVRKKLCVNISKTDYVINNNLLMSCLYTRFSYIQKLYNC